MENLTTLEASLLLVVRIHPGKTLAEYTAELDEAYIKVIHAMHSLVNYAHIRKEGETYFINEDHESQEGSDISKEFGVGLSGVVHTVDSLGPKTELKPDMNKISEASILQLLKDANGKTRTAKIMGEHFGCKGTALGQLLRKLVSQGKVVKAGTLYKLAQEEDQVTTIKPVLESRRILTSVHEVRAVIQNMKDAFTADTCHAEISKAFIIDKSYFLEVFGDLSMDGYFNVRDGDDYVDPALEFDPSNWHSVRRILPANEVATVLDTYFSTNAPPPYDLNVIIPHTHLAHDAILEYFVCRGFDINDYRHIVKEIVRQPIAVNDPVAEKVAPIQTEKAVDMGVKKSKGYNTLEDLDVEDIKEYLVGGVRLPVFVKHFNLDIAKSGDVKRTLVAAGIAEYVEVTNFLFPARVEELVLRKEAEAEPNMQPISTARTSMDEPATPSKLTAEYQRGDLKYAATSNPNVVVTKAPKHVEDKNHAYYGHRIVHVVDGIPKCSVLPDYIWLAEQKEKENAKHVVEAEELPSGGSVYENTMRLTLQAPTGQPPHVWTEGEEQQLTEALKEVARAEDRLPPSEKDEAYTELKEALETEGVAVPLRTLDGCVVNPEVLEKVVISEKAFDRLTEIIDEEFDVDMELVPNDDIDDASDCDPDEIDWNTDEEIEQYCETLKPHLDDILHKHVQARPNAGCGRISPGVGVGERNEHRHVSKPDPAWLMVLEMLEQRLTFEHQSRAASQLREIRDYLEGI